MIKAIDLIDSLNEIKLKGIEYNFEGEQVDIICRFRAFLSGVMTGRPPLRAEDIEEDDRWTSEYPGLFSFFGKDKSKFLKWCGELAMLLGKNPSVAEINKFYTDSGLPEVVDHLSLEPTTTPKLYV